MGADGERAVTPVTSSQGTDAGGAKIRTPAQNASSKSDEQPKARQEQVNAPARDAAAVAAVATAQSSAASHDDDKDTTAEERANNYNAALRKDQARFGEGSTLKALQRNNQQKALLIDQHKVAEQAHEDAPQALKPIEVPKIGHLVADAAIARTDSNSRGGPGQGD
jgi:hypothetical protein